jgi:hypothetical protein
VLGDGVTDGVGLGEGGVAWATVIVIGVPASTSSPAPLSCSITVPSGTSAVCL